MFKTFISFGAKRHKTVLFGVCVCFFLGGGGERYLALTI
jgi:hypothetical protein